MRGGVRISARMGHTHSPFAYVYERIRTYIYIYIHVHDERTHSRCRVRNKDKSREDKKIKYTQESAGSGKITRTKRTLCRIVVGTGGGKGEIGHTEGTEGRKTTAGGVGG